MQLSLFSKWHWMFVIWQKCALAILPARAILCRGRSWSQYYVYCYYCTHSILADMCPLTGLNAIYKIAIGCSWSFMTDPGCVKNYTHPESRMELESKKRAAVISAFGHGSFPNEQWSPLLISTPTSLSSPQKQYDDLQQRFISLSLCHYYDLTKDKKPGTRPGAGSSSGMRSNLQDRLNFSRSFSSTVKELLITSFYELNASINLKNHVVVACLSRGLV